MNENETQPIEREIVKLEEVPYLGEGFFHWFRNNKTGEEISVECTEAEYNTMTVKGGAENNPAKRGHIWLYSWGGTVKVDTPSGFLEEGQYTRRDTDTVVNAGERGIAVVPNEKVDHESNFDKVELKK